MLLGLNHRNHKLSNKARQAEGGQLLGSLVEDLGEHVGMSNYYKLPLLQQLQVQNSRALPLAPRSTWCSRARSLYLPARGVFRGTAAPVGLNQSDCSSFFH